MKSFGCMPAVRTPEASRTLTVSCPGILPSPLRDKVGTFHHDRFRGYVSVHFRSGLPPPCLRFAVAVTGHHAKLGTRLLVRLCRGRHRRRLNSMRLQGATRTKPCVRLSRIRLPPWVCGDEASARPRMEDARFWQPGVRQLCHSLPRDPSLVAATPQRAPPEVENMVPECVQCPAVGRHCVVGEVAGDDPVQPSPLFRDRLMHAPLQLLLDLLELRPHAAQHERSRAWLEAVL